MKNNRTRRSFLRDAAAGIGGAALTSVPARASSAASQDRVAGSNRRIRVGLIGCGGQGGADLRAMLRKEVDLLRKDPETIRNAYGE